MELIQIRYFSEVARLESFSKAAETLHITQSALSKSIAKLEEEVGVQLFERQGNRIHLNQVGKVLLRSFEQTLVGLENGIAQARDLVGKESGSVRIGIGSDVFINNLIRDFLLTHPSVSMTCLLLSKQQMETSLNEGTVDFTVSSEEIEGPELFWQPIYEDRLTVLVSQNHPVARRKSLYLEELADERFIITSIAHGMRSSTYSLCRRAGFEPKILYEGYDNELAGLLTGNGLGVMVTPNSITLGVDRYRKGPSSPVIKVPLMDSFAQRRVGICAKRGHHQSAAALELHAMIVEYFQNLI